MRTTFALAAVFAAVAIGTPTNFQKRQLFQCGTGSAQCCATDVLGIADLNCATPPTPPTDIANFTAICAEIGQQAKCCDIPILGQALICTAPE